MVTSPRLWPMPGIGIWIMGLLVFVFSSVQTNARAQQSGSGESVKKTLQQQNFPWYDSPKNEMIPVFRDKPPEPQELPKGTELSGPSMEGIARVLLWVFIIFLVVLIVAGLVWIGLPPPSKQVEVNQATTLVETDRLEALPETVRGKGDLLARARELVKAKAFSQAITFFHSWQLLQLDKLGRIELQKGKTNRQYLGELSSAPVELRKIFRDSTRLFEEAFYGHLPINEEEFLAVWDKQPFFEGKLVLTKGGRK